MSICQPCISFIILEEGHPYKGKNLLIQKMGEKTGQNRKGQIKLMGGGAIVRCLCTLVFDPSAVFFKGVSGQSTQCHSPQHI